MKLKACCFSALLLFLLSLGLAYQFIWRGSVAPASDGRIAILLPDAERDLVLEEMRAFLQAVRAALGAIGANDPEALATATRAVGSSVRNSMPGSLVGRLPAGFKQLGFDTHRAFDQLALDAEQLGDMGYSLQQLTILMDNCVSCHATYRIDRLME